VSATYRRETVLTEELLKERESAVKVEQAQDYPIENRWGGLLFICLKRRSHTFSRKRV